ncbi:hypothetical protein [Solimonas marina]|uniref:Uncharacterized protein n=1 Tax=Solimonas marina TaxID=2714601 RepID=A0A969WGU9_9GAMM|nr:hypothetical protein [Solimonas marina]NKF24435.1 hypothetical protein [Solimonas marina]
MSALNLLNAVLLALSATFALTLGVVVLLYGFHLDAAPRLRAEWHVVSQLASVFVLLTAVAAAAFWGQWRQRQWRWPAQSALWLALGGSGWWMQRLLA